MNRFVLAVLVLGMLHGGCAGWRCRPAPCVAAGPRTIPNPMPRPTAERPQFLVEMHCARIDVEALPNTLGIPPGDGRTLVANETEAGARALLERWRKHPAVTITQAPSLVAMEGDEASIWVGETVKAAASPDSRPASDRYAPAADFLGTMIFVRVTETPSGAMQVEFHGAWKQLDPATEALSDDAAAFGRAVAALPAARAEATFEMTDRGHVVIAAPRVRRTDGTFRMFTLLHLVRLAPEEASSIVIEQPPRIDGPEPDR